MFDDDPRGDFKIGYLTLTGMARNALQDAIERTSDLEELEDQFQVYFDDRLNAYLIATGQD